MKIAFFSDSFYPRKCGVTTYITVTTERLKELGHEVMIVVPKHKNGPTEREMKARFGVEVVLLPSVTAKMIYPDFRIGAPTAGSLLRVRKFNPDVIHIHTPGTVGFEGVLSAKVLKTPLVSTFHTYFMELEGFKVLGLKGEGKVSDVLNRALWSFAERFYKPSDVVIAPTQFVAADLKKRWKKQWIEVVPGGVEVKRFETRTQRKKLRDKYGLKNSFVVLWVGRLSQEKNLDVLITAFSMLYLKHPEARLVMIGDGPASKSLAFYSKALGLNSAVKFLGAIPYKELAGENYYSMGDVFVTPSTWDTQGLAIVEAMAAGVPVVAPKVRAMPEIVDGGGVLVKANDPMSMANGIVKIMEKKELYKSMSEKAVKRAKEYSVENSVDKLVGLYRKVKGKRNEAQGK